MLRPTSLVALVLALLLAGTILLLDRLGPEASPPPDSTWTLDPPTAELRLADRPPSRADTLVELLSVEDAVQFGRDWLLLDSRSSRVLRVGADGQVLWASGGHGEGPSEFEMGRWLAASEGVVAVLTADGSRLVRYSLDGAALAPVDLATVGCGFGPAQGLAASEGGAFLVLKSCTELDLSVHGVVVRIEADGKARMAGRHLLTSAGAQVDPFRVAAFAVWNGGTYLGALSEGCLSGLDEVAGPARICLAESERLALPDSIRRQITARNEILAERGVDFSVPERLPAFVGVRSLPSALLFQVPGPDGRDALDLVRPDSSRTRIRVDDPRAVFVGQGEILRVQEILEGTVLQRVPWGGG